MMFLPLGLAALGPGRLDHHDLRGEDSQSSKAPAAALRTGTLGAPVLFLIGARVADPGAGPGRINIWFAVICGAAGGVAIGLITEYYTAAAPVRKIAKPRARPARPRS